MMSTLSKSLGPVLSLGLLFGAPAAFSAQETPAAPAISFEKVTYEAPRTDQPIVIDGRLDEPVWQQALRIELDYETRPGENVKPPVETIAYVTFDDQNVYFGFDARDPDPKAIRANLTDRDQCFRDDFVGVILDTFNDERRGFEFFVNPLGVQMDLTVDDLANGNEDASWDAIWSSAGRITEQGYVVEMSLPFSSLRFQKVDGPQTWGFMPYRAYPRTSRHQIFDSPRNRNVSCWLCQASKLTGFDGVEPGRSLEFTPTLTAGRNDTRADFPSGSLQSGDAETDLGLTASWGVTPNINLSGTINPDFSQVEADAAQLDINNTFALFFPERRPFFLEGADFFSTPLSTVFTRNVADPAWGVKAVGKEGQNAFGVFVAEDDLTQILLPGTFFSDTASLDEKSVDSVVRYRRDIGAGSAVGLVVTDREGSGYSNRVAGVDGLMRINANNTFRFQALGSQTQYPDEVLSEHEDQPEGRFSDQAFHLGYDYSSRAWRGYVQYEDVGQEFRADLGFLPQVGRKAALLGGYRHFYGKEGSPWTKLSIGADVNLDRTSDGTTLEEEWEVFFEADGPWQSYFFLGPGLRDRYWNGVVYRENYVSFFVNSRPSGSLSFNVEGTVGDQVDFANDRLGKVVSVAPGVQFSLGRHLRFEMDHAFRQLKADGGTVFTANLSQVRAIYQFNIRTFVRALVQYTDIERDPRLWVDPVDPQLQDLFTQLLFSYKLNPRTVLFLGYSDGRRGDQEIDLTQESRSVFLKIGYAWAV